MSEPDWNDPRNRLFHVIHTKSGSPIAHVDDRSEEMRHDWTNLLDALQICQRAQYVDKGVTPPEVHHHHIEHKGLGKIIFSTDPDVKTMWHEHLVYPTDPHAKTTWHEQ
jgi:hypothetical protein